MSDEPRYVPFDDVPSDDEESPRPEKAAPSRPVKLIGNKPPPAAVTSAPKAPIAAQPTAQTAPVVVEPVPRPIRLVLPLSDALQTRIKAIRVSVGLSGESPRDVPLTGIFTPPDASKVQETIAELTKKLLPLTVTLTRVQAAVRDQQTYSAAWEIDDAERLAQLHAELIAPFKDVLSKDNPPFVPSILIGDNVAARAFPALIAAMQRDFESLTWQIESISVIDSP